MKDIIILRVNKIWQWIKNAIKKIVEYYKANKRESFLVIIGLSIIFDIAFLGIIYYFILKQKIEWLYFWAFIIIYSEIILAYLFFLVNGIIDLFRTNRTLSIIGIIIWGYISIVSIAQSKILTFGMMRNVLISLATIGTLMVAFIPQGIITINKKYKPNGKSLYNENELSKELINIIYPLIFFVGLYIVDVLLGLMLSDNSESISYYLFPVFNNYVDIIYRTVSTFYMAMLSVGSSLFIYGFIKIINIVMYYYFYEQDFNKLKSKYKNFNIYDLDWLINKKLYGYAMNKYNIISMQGLIDEFNKIKNQSSKLSNKKIIKTIEKMDQVGNILNKK
ncbi:MAG: hypothetical protein ACYCSZ_15070 [Burkholderiales bacterium]